MTVWDTVRIVFFVFLVIFQRVPETKADEVQMCSCSNDTDGGCAANQLCDPGNNCNKENVAYGKTASISSRYSKSGYGTSGPACAAVNGRTGHTMYKVTEPGTNCVHTAGNDNNAWWQVDLGDNYTITDITIYNRESQTTRLAAISISVDNIICKRLPFDGVTYGLIYPITCDTPLRGQVVKMYKNSSDDGDKKFINVCEVQIWVCKPGLFGQDCSEQCQCHNNVTCDNHFGTCPNGCMAGYYEASCSERCGQCLLSEVCDGTNGHCSLGCEPGYQPPLCNDTCENKTYGDNCTEQCGRCENFAACNVFNGSCQACEGNFALPLCTECVDGYFGAECNVPCGLCADDKVCDKVTGRCPNGCQPGFQSPWCDQLCLNKTYGEHCREQCGRCENFTYCNVFNGTCRACEGNFSLPLCTECLDGYFDADCSVECGQCADNAVCSKVTGHCPGSCQPGYQLPRCLQTCENKTHGENCREQCGRCENSAACNVFNGSCQACEGNFAFPFCTDCADGYHGNACRQQCGQCADSDVCDKVTGHCPNGCPAGYQTPYCDTTLEQRQEEPSQGGVIGGAVVAALVVVAAVVVGVLVVRRRRKQKERSSGSSHMRLQSEHGRDTSEHPLTALQEMPKRPTVKPSLAVKPFKTKKTKAQNNDAEESHHIYTNVPAMTTRSVPATRANPPRQLEQTKTNEPAPEREPTDEKGKGALDDEAPLYGNVGNVYAQFKATKPELDRVQKYLADKLASGQLPEEFRSIAKTDEDVSIQAGNAKINFKKNRFAQIIPYDRSRVILTDGYSEGTSTDFVNASYISGYQKERKYIAAQGPRDNTVGDLWRLVWQEKITHIVMLTNLKEHGKPKCELYWPEEESTTETYGPVTVTTSQIQQRDNFYIRSFTVTRDGGRESREVAQYHYVSWPDHGVPTTTSLVMFWRYVTRETKHDSAPLLVHCSAGVGRTGSYIGLDIGLDTAVSVGSIDVIHIVSQLRQERTLMVQATDQYVFLHEALLEAYTARDTVVSLDEFDVIFPQPITARTPNARIDTEFKVLMQMQPLMSECRHDNALQDINMAKNRSATALPLDNHIVYLTERVEDRNQYINAVFMPTFRDPKGSILTQLPLPSTLVDFWRLVYGNDVTTIVSLSSPNEEQEVASYCQYWPREPSKPVKSGPYTVTLTSKSTVFTTFIMYDITVQKAGTSSARSLRVLHYEGWTGEVGGDTSHMLQLVDTLTTALMEADTPTLLIQCCDGVGKSGLFSALCDVINHMTYDRELDVYMTVRHVQNVRPSAVTSLAQYRYCYEVAQQRHRDMSIYANT